MGKLQADFAVDEQTVQAFTRLAPALRSWLRRRLPTLADVEDVLQDAFLELIISRRAARQIEDVGAWLFRVARNRVVDRYRKRQSQARVELYGPDLDAGLASLAELLPDSRAGPEAAYARAVLVDEVLACVARLPAEQRKVFLAHEVEGLAFAQISARTGVGVNTLLARKRYAVLQLRQRLAAVYAEYQQE